MKLSCLLNSFYFLFNYTELDYLTSSNFMEMLDTGVLVCHLARIIQTKAKDVVITRQHRHGASENITTTTTSTTTYFNSSSNGDETPEGHHGASTGGMKQAQQYLQALLRGANNHANLLAAAKVLPHSHSHLLFSRS